MERLLADGRLLRAAGLDRLEAAVAFVRAVDARLVAAVAIVRIAAALDGSTETPRAVHH
jgi:hypothetical protein